MAEPTLADRVDAASPLTSYLILRRNGATWMTITEKSGRNAETAIREVVATLAEADQDGTFVAVPARSWKPVSVKPTTVTTLELKATA